MQNLKLKNGAVTVLLALILGAVVGLVLWLFLQLVSLGTSLIWDVLPMRTGLRWITVPLCALGGLLTGLLHWRCGDYPEPLHTVMGKVKRDKHYDYKPMAVILACALLPLVFGASVGPEAGLTGIIAALCYWIGDNLTYAKNHASLYAELGEAVTLGQVFHVPLFGILAVEESAGEDAERQPLPKAYKLVLYGLAAAANLLVYAGLNRLFHTSGLGFPRFDEVSIAWQDYVLALVCIPVGLLLCWLFERLEALTAAAAKHVPVVLKETLCGVVIGLMGLAVPMVLFSGEEQMAELMETFGSFAPWFLIGICLLKLFMTAFCLSFGMKGGHFFPLIFACVCMGFGLAMLVFPDPAQHVVFAAGVVTATTLGAQLKKPLAVAVLTLLCFPVRLLFWLFLAAAVGSRVGQLMERRKAPAKVAEGNAAEG